MFISARAPRQGGVTLVELLMFIVIVSVALVGVLQVLRYSAAHSADPLRRKQALMLAESLMEEVQMAKFTLCDPASGNADTATSAADCTVPEAFGQSSGGEVPGPRPYDNVNDYVLAGNTPSGAMVSSAAGAPLDINGNAIDVTGYTVSLTIRPEALNNITVNGAGADQNVLRITVTVNFDGEALVLDGYRTRYAPNDR